MIKNIHVLSTALFIFVNTTLHSKPEITIQDLAPQSIEQLQAFSKNNPGAFTIHVVPQKGWLESMTALLATPFHALSTSLSLKNISLTLVSGALSLGWISYLLCAYVMYKTALIIKNVNSWVNWCSDDDLLSDYDALYRKFDSHTKRQPKKKKSLTLQQEKNILGMYLRLDAFLKAHHLRHHFPHVIQRKQVKRAYAKLEKAEEFFTLRHGRIRNSTVT